MKTILTPVDFSGVTEAVIARVQHDGVCFVGGAEWRGRWAMRISITSARTTDADVDLSADAIIAAWRAVQAESPNASANSRYERSLSS